MPCTHCGSLRTITRAWEKGNPELRNRRCVARVHHNVGAAAPRTPPSRECATLHRHHSLGLPTGNTRGGNVCDAKRLTKWRTVHLSNRSAQTDSNKHDARPASVVGLKKQASQSSFFNDSSHSEMRSQKFMSWKSNRIILDHWDSLSRMAGVIHRCNARSRQHSKEKEKKREMKTEEYTPVPQHVLGGGTADGTAPLQQHGLARCWRRCGRH